jgi:SAM-dependent methyltransferase
MRKSSLDSTESLQQEYARIRRKGFLNRLYCDFYKEICSALPWDGEGAVVEMGAGAGFLKAKLPEAITGDIRSGAPVDVRFDAHRLPFKNSSLRAVVLQNVFHHLQSPDRFLQEAARCLQPGGAMIMIEPWITLASYKVLRLLHHERTDPRQAGWDFTSTGPMSGANQALPWIVFQRDRRFFEVRFPELEIEEITLHTPISYLISGGLTPWQPVPGFLYPLVRRLEQKLKPLFRWIAMFATVIVRRRGAPGQTTVGQFDFALSAGSD